jgi:hypothetical protein
MKQPKFLLYIIYAHRPYLLINTSIFNCPDPGMKFPYIDIGHIKITNKMKDPAASSGVSSGIISYSLQAAGN